MQLRHPNILARLRAEVDASMPYNVLIPSLDQVKLPYLNMILKETLRYHSTGFGTFRTCLVDTEVSRVTLPANATLALWNPAGQQHIH
jgi:cholesterol 24-hydroxylase